MNKVTTINLNGNAYQLEENGYEALRAYLDNASRSLQGNPDRDEIIADIERAIADKFQAVLGPNKTVVVAREVETIISEMGPVQDASTPEGGPSAQASGAAGAGGTAERGAGGDPGLPRRLYRIREGGKIAGVCNGLAAYFNLDVSIIRILFIVLTVTWGFGLLLYVVMMFVLPAATTMAEKTAAFGVPSTAEEFIRRAKEGYYEGMKTFRDKAENRWKYREWKRKFRQERRAWRFNMERRAWNMAFRRGEKEDPCPGGPGWQQQWAAPPPFSMGMAVILPIMEVYKVLVTILGFYGAYSLLAHGSVFGVYPPAGMPTWVAAVIFIFLCSILSIPAKIFKYSCHYHRAHWVGYYGALESIVWMGIVLVGLWYADHHYSQVHEAFRQVIPALHQALDSIRLAWHTK